MVPSLFSHQNPFHYPAIKLKSPLLSARFGKLSLQCSSNIPPLGSGSGETDSKSVLDAFFLGKALAETINERVESAVGELLSVVGRLQAEQQKQVQHFTDDVLERAKRAKENAAREAMESPSLASPTIAHPQSTTVTRDASSSSSGSDTTSKDPLLGMFTED